jgi:hypothetical protein
VPHKVRTLRKQRLKLELLTRLLLHEDLCCPANQPGFAPNGERFMTRASRQLRPVPARGGNLSPQCGDRLICWALSHPRAQSHK